MDIVAAAHAVRVLEALVEQHEEMQILSTLNMHGPRGRQYQEYVGALVLALVEGAKAALDNFHVANKQAGDHKCDWGGCEGMDHHEYMCASDGWDRAVVALAQAYAPWMEKAGMTLPLPDHTLKSL